ncbi:Isopentenyl-diphosphate Delta-isomerase [uncultured archaeon]|nr:Isopentenyl-diphosphate Delta-isomerase [uncultured archaeon]
MDDRKNLVVLVDEHDREIGTEDKLRAHQNGGMLHRAISIFVFNARGETMLQQRAMSKYHTPGRWTNTCCSHPYPNESVIDAAHRRLREEMGFDCEMNEAFAFTYLADVGNGLTESEFDHVIFGAYDKDPEPNPEEAMSYRWIGLEGLKKEIEQNPDAFTPWLRIVLDKVIDYRKNGRA